MDILSQTKLSQSEWESIEVPISESEIKILNMMYNHYGKDEAGNSKVNLVTNPNLNMVRFTKLSPTPEIQAFLYQKYFYPIVDANFTKLKKTITSFQKYNSNTKSSKVANKLKKADLYRIENSDRLFTNQNHNVYEFDCMEKCNQILSFILKKQLENIAKPLYTIIKWNQAVFDHTNPFVLEFMKLIIDYCRKITPIDKIVYQAESIIEKNNDLYKYDNLSLFEHQKELYSLCLQEPKRKRYENEDIDSTGDIVYTPKPKLILYTAPTGTGKTLSPIGLTNEYKVIFVCVARHVGLALARSAISIHKRVAFAFGCETPSDIRLHYFSASDYTKNWKTGGIWKVNHNNGSKVELMICDVHSYLHAMRYMMSFNKDHSTLLTYWDEPTMTLDYKDHPLHKTIQKNWTENKIYNMVLSCATLPKEHEIQDCIQDFREQVDEYFEEHRNEQLLKFNNEMDEVKELNDERKEEGLPLLEPVICPYIPLEEYREENKVYILKPLDYTSTMVDIRTITSYDCKKSIPILTQNGYSFMPHIHCDDNEQLKTYTSFCKNNKTLLRYFDLKEIVNLIHYVHDHKYINREHHQINQYFDSIEQITMNNMKLYYLELLQSITEPQWESCKAYLTVQQVRKCSNGKMVSNNMGLTRLNSVPSSLNNSSSRNSGGPITRISSESNVDMKKKDEKLNALEGVYLTTKDAHTLTDGPSIYLADNVLNMAKFYVKESKIPDSILRSLVDNIVNNEKLQEQMTILERKLEEELKPKNSESSGTFAKSKGNGNSKNYKEKDDEKNINLQTIHSNLDNLRSQVQRITLNPNYVPNSREHQEKWVRTYSKDPFSSSLSENDVKDIIELDITIHYKVLVLMGVGVLVQQENKQYEEIVKRLASNQKLFLILTSSDYIYGTNYQFCHGFIGKDLKQMTPQKTLQAMGRVGRNNFQQDYTIRFRDDNMIHNLFKEPEFNREAYNMNTLFCRNEENDDDDDNI